MKRSCSTSCLLVLLAILGLGGNAGAKDELWLCWTSARPTDRCYAYLTERIENPGRFSPDEQSENFAKRASVFLHRADYARALHDAGKALEIDIGNTNALDTRASSLMRLGRYDEAIIDYSKLVEITKNGGRENVPLVLALKTKADALRRAGRWAQAVEEYTRTIQELERSKLSVVSSGGVSMLAEVIIPLPADPTAPRGALPPKVLPANKSPLAADLFTFRGDTYQALGDLDRAREDYRRAEEITSTLRPLKSNTTKPAETHK